MKYSKMVSISLICLALIGVPLKNVKADDQTEICFIMMDLCEVYVASELGHSNEWYWAGWNQCADNLFDCLGEVIMN